MRTLAQGHILPQLGIFLSAAPQMEAEAAQRREAVRHLREHHCPGARALINYLLHHYSRPIDYGAWQEEGHSLGSGQVESLVKQIVLRVK